MARSPGEARARAYEAFRATVPPEVARVVEPFHAEQWHLLCLARDVPGAVELLAATPALGFGLAVSDRLVDEPVSRDEARRLVRVKQAVLLDRLGLPASGAARRVLARVDPGCLDATALYELGQALARPQVLRWLGHLARVHAGVVAMVVDPALEALLTPALLAEVSADDTQRLRATTARALADVVRLSAALGESVSPARLRTPAAVERCRDELAATWARGADPASTQRFPAPPLPPIPGVEPLQSEAALVAEGRHQHHCVATYAEEVRAGVCYIYRITGVERATLEVVRGHDGGWHRGQLLASCNQPVQPATVAFVDAWIDRWAP